MSAPGTLADRADELRREFDDAFAEPVRLAREQLLDFLAIRVAGDPYAVPLGGIAGLYADRTVVEVPSKNPALLGVAGFRGTVAPVYDLRALLGYHSGGALARERPRWLLLVGGDQPISFAFESFEAQLRVGEEALSTAAAAEDGFARGTVRANGVERTVLSLEHLRARIVARG